MIAHHEEINRSNALNFTVETMNILNHQNNAIDDKHKAGIVATILDIPEALMRMVILRCCDSCMPFEKSFKRMVTK